MLRGYRSIVCALGGLILASAGLPPQQAAQPNQGASQSASKANIARIATAPEKLPQAENPDTGCDQGRDDRKSDLCAQWKAADAAYESATWTRRTFWLGIAGAVIGLFTLGAASFAAWWAKKAAEHTETGSNQARRGADAAEKGLEGADRPHILLASSALNLKEPSLDGFPLTFQFKNFGSGPAWIIKFGYAVRTYTPNEHPEQIPDVPNTVEAWALAPGFQWGSDTPTMMQVAPDVAEQLVSGQQTLLVFWRIVYNDADGRPHTHQLVQQYDGETNRLFPRNHAFWCYS